MQLGWTGIGALYVASTFAGARMIFRQVAEPAAIDLLAAGNPDLGKPHIERHEREPNGHGIALLTQGRRVLVGLVFSALIPLHLRWGAVATNLASVLGRSCRRHVVQMRIMSKVYGPFGFGVSSAK